MDPVRHINFENCFNFRDLGGYEALDGRRVRRRTVYRSDSLHRMTQNDLDVVLRLGLRTVIDFRSTAELSREAPPRFGDDVIVRHLPIFEEDALPFKSVEIGDPEPPPGESYLAMATAGADAIAAALNCIATEGHPVVFHCAAGKDRTGVVAGILLMSLGVPERTVIEDYELSNLSIERVRNWAHANDPGWATEMAAMPPWLLRSSGRVMATFLEMLRTRHGSIEGYLDTIGVKTPTVDTLRRRLLDPVSAGD
jgi:protein-tyrosine phosphatase